MRDMIHRMNANARPLCGVPAGRCSTSGVCLTCPECIRLSRTPSREEQLAALEAACRAVLARQKAGAA